MLTRIRQFERLSAVLEPPANRREELSSQALAHAEDFLNRLPVSNTYRLDKGRSKALEQPFSEAAEDFPVLLDMLEDRGFQ